MKDGYWINYQTGKMFGIDEHERWIRRDDNAKKLGLSQRVVDSFDEFTPTKDRNKFLVYLMKHAPIMRVRGHGNYVTFEYSTRSRRRPMDAIWDWGSKHAGPFTGMRIVNFSTGEETSIYWKDFEQAMDDGGADAVMRVATVNQFEIKAIIAEEVREISQRLK